MKGKVSDTVLAAGCSKDSNQQDTDKKMSGLTQSKFFRNFFLFYNAHLEREDSLRRLYGYCNPFSFFVESIVIISI